MTGARRHPPTRIARMLSSLRFLPVLLATALFAVPAILVALFDRGGRCSSAIVASWARTVLRLAGVTVEIEGRERIPEVSPLLFVATHRSLLDVPALFSLVPSSTRFIAKRELFRIPLFGQAIRLLGFVPVDRTDRRRARRSLEKAAAVPNRQLLVFPEGTRNTGPQLLPFKKGAFALAVDHGMTVVPIACTGGELCLPARSWRMRPGRMKLRVGRALHAGEHADRHALARAVREEMETLLEET